MTRIHGATAYPTPPALDSAADVAATSRPAGVSRSKANPALPIVARAHFDGEVDHLLRLGASQVVMGEREIAAAMLDFAKGAPETA